MSKIVARNARVVISGHDVSGDSNSATLSLTAEAPDVTCFTDSDRVRLPAGIKDCELTVDGFVNTAASKSEELYHGLLSTGTVVSFMPENWTACNVAYAFPCIVTKYDTKYAVADAATTSITCAGSAIVTRGKSLGYLANVLAGSLTGCSMDFGASMVNVFVAFHVLNLEAGTQISASLMSGSISDWTKYVSALDIGKLSASGQSITASLSSASRYAQLKYGATGGSATIVATMGTLL